MTAIRTRREPPPFRAVEVQRVEPRNPYMTRISLTGPALDGFDPGLPAASVRLLIRGDAAELELPTWRGNEFLLADGSRPIIRTVTPLRIESDPRGLGIEIVRHGQGPLSAWADTATKGERAAVSGPGRGYEIDPSARRFLLAGDESALPAITVLLRALPPEAEVRVLVEARHLDVGVELPIHPGATVQSYPPEKGARPGDSLVAAVKDARLDPDVRVWAAGEAAAMQRIRRHLFEDDDVPRSHAVIRGYWKSGRVNRG